jgi:hypothetical protein
MNRVFLAQVGGRLPPARSTGAQGTTQADNNGSFTSKLLGFFGWKSSSQTEVAANTAAERVSPQVTGTTPKIKPTPPVSGGPNIAAVELGKEVSGKMDEVQQRDPVAERDAWSQEAALTFSQVRGGNDASSPRHTDSFDSRWNGLRGIAEPSVTFKTRWALESQ